MIPNFATNTRHILVIADGENQPFSHHRDLKEKELQYNASRGEVNDLERQIENLKW
jgi:hypothetical protein